MPQHPSMIYRPAHTAVLKAIKDGRLIRPYHCEQCGKQNRIIYAHHDDYNKFLEVRWLCSRCHHHWHRNNVPIINNQKQRAQEFLDRACTTVVQKAIIKLWKSNAPPLKT